MSGIYIHIPFCKQACSYCDFYFVTKKDRADEFVSKLIEEIRSKSNSRYSVEKIESIYFGGGTPSLLTPIQVEKIIRAISDTFSLNLKEVTLEMNPDDVDEDYLADIYNAGINRASMGIQTFNEDLLKFMNRAHTSNEALQCLEYLEHSPIQNYTVDLIYGNPNQTIEMLHFDLDRITEVSPNHVSAYALTIEPRTRLGKQYELGRLIPTEDDVVASHFDLVEERLNSEGIQQYEVSNFAKKGFEALHNSAYWSHKNYIGFGPAAHSFWWDEQGDSARRWSNKKDLNSYLLNSEVELEMEEQLTLSTLSEERLMLALRTRKGLDLPEMYERYNFEFNTSQKQYLDIKSEEAKVLLSETNVRLTKGGLKLSDAIVLDLLSL